MLPLYITLQLSLLNITVHPALQIGRIPIRDAMARCRTACLVKTIGNPGIAISQMWVDLTFHPSGMLIVKGLIVILLLTTSSPSIMKMEVAPVSVIACVDVIVIAFRYLCDGWPTMLQAIAAINCGVILIA
jgi:hypothetical protein